MKKIAITGSMGSGKTSVTKLIQGWNYPVFSCDDAVAKMYHENHPLYPELCRLVSSKNDVKKKVRERFFIDLKFKEKIEEIIYTQLLMEMNDFFKKVDGKLCFVEVPLLYELGWEKYFDQSVLVVSDQEIAIKRLMENRDMTREEIEIRWLHQMKDSDKIKRADIVIDNSGSKDELMIEVEKLIKKWEEEKC